MWFAYLPAFGVNAAVTFQVAFVTCGVVADVAGVFLHARVYASMAFQQRFTTERTTALVAAVPVAVTATCVLA